MQCEYKNIVGVQCTNESLPNIEYCKGHSIVAYLHESSEILETQGPEALVISLLEDAAGFLSKFKKQKRTIPPSAPKKPHPIVIARRILEIPDGEILTAELIKQQKRKLASKHHPDKGGNENKMRQVNLAAEFLQSQIANTAA